MRFLIIGGSDAGIAAGLRAHELDPSCDVTLVLADAFPNYSICGLPFFLSGETPDWHSLAHRTDFPGVQLMPNHTAETIDPVAKSVTVRSASGTRLALTYDRDVGDVHLNHLPNASKKTLFEPCLRRLYAARGSDCLIGSGHVRLSCFSWELRPYSVRKACIGSRREARQAGKMQANEATKRRVRVTAPITAGSVGLVP